MLGKLREDQIEQLLETQSAGRLACCTNNVPYLVPVHYIYKDGLIYAHSAPGKKIEMMRENPNVCFEVETIKNIFSWQTVVINGLFEEVTDPNKKHQIMQGIIHRLMPLMISPSGHPSHGITALENSLGNQTDLIVYSIRPLEKSGRFEENESSF